MRRFAFLIFLMLSFLNSKSVTVPLLSQPHDQTTIIHPSTPILNLATAKIREVEKLLGRKMKLKEKIAFRFLQWKIKKGFVTKKENNKKDKGQTAMIFGIIALASIFIPYVGGISFIVFTILALVFGYQAKKKNPEDRKAKTAIILGWIGVGLFVLAFAIAIAVLASWGAWGWG